MLNKILAVGLGFGAGFLVVGLAMFISSLIYPPPKDLDMQDREAMTSFVQSLPVGAFLVVLLGHASGALVGGFVCGLISNEVWQLGPLIVGVGFLLSGILNLRMVPHPTWFAALDLLLYLPAAWLGGYFSTLL
ncbi:hypothetical protein [Thalassoroseus pseudoceratinae]|uniref:hypothetical protein n=1 Tax=Thalassoroseus pseudoceratinae TaxID=2713176 RepID=UPI00141F9603|nr:hypothetical protein [Thalassoroseus pseudoceratinae]